MAQDHKDLKKSGLKATLPRLKILSLFEHSDAKHLSAEDVYKLLIKSGEDVGLATVYRVLTQFEQAGLLIRHHFESDKAVFELSDSQHHDHIVCMQCGHVEEFCDDEIEKRQKIIANKKGFVIQEHSLYIYAECTKAPCPNKV
jgi:Fur family ferric uptake transcriptional regulator